VSGTVRPCSTIIVFQQSIKWPEALQLAACGFGRRPEAYWPAPGESPWGPSAEPQTVRVMPAGPEPSLLRFTSRAGVMLGPYYALPDLAQRKADGRRPLRSAGKFAASTTFLGSDRNRKTRSVRKTECRVKLCMSVLPSLRNTASHCYTLASSISLPRDCVRCSLSQSCQQDVISFARDAKSAHLVVLNDVPSAKFSGTSRSLLTAQRVPVAKAQVSHRPSHIAALAAGKTASEINGGRDKLAASEIEALWLEVKAAATKAAKARRKEEVGS
jgi:hypothetical protein